MKQGLDEIRRTIREQEAQKPFTFLSTKAFELRFSPRYSAVYRRPAGERRRSVRDLALRQICLAELAALGVAALIFAILIAATGVSVWQPKVAITAKMDALAKATAERTARE